jgi:hypothetical protein
MNPFSKGDWKKSAYERGPGWALGGAILLPAVIMLTLKS